MTDPRRIVTCIERVRTADPPPTYQKTQQPDVTMPFAGAQDGGDYVTLLFQIGQMETTYHRWSYHVTQGDLPPNEGGQWVLRGQPMWIDSIVDSGNIQFDPSWSWPGLWTIGYQQLNPQPAYGIVESVRFNDDWVLTTQPTPPTQTWYARLTHTPGTAVVAQDIVGVSPSMPWYLRRHDIHAVSIVEDHAHDIQTLTAVCDFYPDPAPPGG